MDGSSGGSSDGSAGERTVQMGTSPTDSGPERAHEGKRAPPGGPSVSAWHTAKAGRAGPSRVGAEAEPVARRVTSTSFTHFRNHTCDIHRSSATVGVCRTRQSGRVMHESEGGRTFFVHSGAKGRMRQKLPISIKATPLTESRAGERHWLMASWAVSLSGSASWDQDEYAAAPVYTEGSAASNTRPTAASMTSSLGSVPNISVGHATTPVSIETAASSRAPSKTSVSICRNGP